MTNGEWHKSNVERRKSNGEGRKVKEEKRMANPPAGGPKGWHCDSRMSNGERQNENEKKERSETCLPQF